MRPNKKRRTVGQTSSPSQARSREAFRKTGRMTIRFSAAQVGKIEELADALSERRLETVELAPMVREALMRDVGRQLSELAPVSVPA